MDSRPSGPIARRKSFPNTRHDATDASIVYEVSRRHGPPFPDPEVVARLFGVIASERPQIVHAHNWMVNAFLPLKPIFPVPLVMTLHDYGLLCAKKSLMFRDNPCSGPGLTKCFGCASQHYGVSKGSVTTLSNRIMRQWLRRTVDHFVPVSVAVGELNRLTELNVRYDVIPNFVPDDIDKVSPSDDPRLGRLPPDGFILFVGDLISRKGLNVILRAYPALRDPPALVLIGRRSPEIPAVLPANIHVFHNWPHELIMLAWQRCLFGLAPSTWPEPCATVVIEAMAVGKPVIVTRIGGMTDMVDDAVNGLVIPPDDAAALASAMRLLLEHPEQREAIGRAALEKVVGFKSASVVSRIEQLYYRLEGGNISRSRTSLNSG